VDCTLIGFIFKWSNNIGRTSAVFWVYFIYEGRGQNLFVTSLHVRSGQAFNIKLDLTR